MLCNYAWLVVFHQPSWKICAFVKTWLHLPQFCVVKIPPKIFELPPPRCASTLLIFCQRFAFWPSGLARWFRMCRAKHVTSLIICLCPNQDVWVVDLTSWPDSPLDSNCEPKMMAFFDSSLWFLVGRENIWHTTLSSSGHTKIDGWPIERCNVHSLNEEL